MAFTGDQLTAFMDVAHGESGGVWYPTGLQPGAIDNRLLLRADTLNLERPIAELAAAGAVVRASSPIGQPATSVFGVTALGAFRDIDGGGLDFGPAFRLSIFEEFPNGDPDFELPDPDRFHDEFGVPNPKNIKAATTSILNLQICRDSQNGVAEIVSYIDPDITIMGPFQTGQGPVFMNGSSNNSWEFDNIVIPNGWGVKITDPDDMMLVSITYRFRP